MSVEPEKTHIEEFHAKSATKMWEHGRTDIRLAKLEDTVETLKSSVLGMEIKLIKKIDDLIDSQSKNTNQNYLLTEKLAMYIEQGEGRVSEKVVTKMFAILAIIWGAKELIQHFTGR